MSRRRSLAAAGPGFQVPHRGSSAARPSLAPDHRDRPRGRSGGEQPHSLSTPNERRYVDPRSVHPQVSYPQALHTAAYGQVDTSYPVASDFRYPARDNPNGDLPPQHTRNTAQRETPRRSQDSDKTLLEPGNQALAKGPQKKPEGKGDDQKYSLSSYKHPYEIAPPESAYTTKANGRAAPRVSFAGGTRRDFDEEAQALMGNDGDIDDDVMDIGGGDYCQMNDRDGRRRGIMSNLMDLYGAPPGKNGLPHSRRRAYAESIRSEGKDTVGWRDSDDESEILDADDPRMTGVTKRCLDDYEDEKRNALRQMDYRQRRKERQRVRIEFNVTSIVNRHLFLLKLARALMTFGAPSHRIESQLVAAARILEVDAEFIHLPNVIICSFGDSDTMTSETHFVKCGGGLALGNLHKVHLIYRAVVHDELSARKATEQLDALLMAEPLYPVWLRCVLSFFLSSLICPLAFGGSFLDMWVAGAGAFVLCFLQLRVAAKSAMYANVFEITTAMLMSFTARGLGSIRSEIFCYTAISSAGIIGILPGYLILSSSLELASKNIVCGSVKMVYALIYTLFLGFGLQIGSDLYLLFDPTARHHLATLAAELSTTTTLVGTFAPDNATDGTPPAMGTFTFTNATNSLTNDIVDGCYRPASFPWYLQPFPFWAQFLIVPTFSILSSLANLQPWKSRQLPVMVVISCASYATNKIANHYIFNRSDVVSAIGAFTVGLLGNMYSRKMGGTAFTSMVTGVLFLVPSGLSQAGGVAGNGSGVDVGTAMIAVTIGITVGLFMSQAIVYMFGSRKNAAVFSF